MAPRPSLPAMIERTKASLDAVTKDKPRSRRRIELELQLRDLRTKQLRGEIRSQNRTQK